jgi:hypothetical protein
LRSEVKVWDAQPSENGIVIYLSGLLLIEGESNPINFVRVFFLASANNSFFSKIYFISFLLIITVRNDIYKITFS